MIEKKKSIINRLNDWSDDFDEIGPEGPAKLREALASVAEDDEAWIGCYGAFILKAQINRENALAMLANLPVLRERVERYTEAEGKDTDAVGLSFFIHCRLLALPGGLLELSLDRIRAFMEETRPHMERGECRRLQDYRDVMLDLGDRKKAAEFHQQYQDLLLQGARRGYCDSCQKGKEKDLSYAYRIGDLETARELWLEIKKKDYYRCATQDDCLSFHLHTELYALAALEDWEELQEAMRRLRLSETDRDLDVYPFLVQGRQWARALAVFEQQWAYQVTHGLSIRALHFSLASLQLMDGLLAEGRAEVELAPGRFGQAPAPAANGQYEIAAIRAWLLAFAQDLAAQLDARNGNPAYGEQLAVAQAGGAILPEGKWEELLGKEGVG